MKTGLAAAVELLLPRQCPGCGACDAQARPLCRPCAEELLDLVGLPSCPRCGASLADDQPPSPDGCRRCPTPMPRFDSVVRVGPYVGPLAGIVRQVKFHAVHHDRRWLSGMLAVKVRADAEACLAEVVQPVPLHWIRCFRRGYNQAGVLASALARDLKLPVSDELVRVRNTPPQVGLPREERAANVRGAFQADRPRLVVGRHVLLVDDVTTTGATAGDAARALRQAGAARVSLAVLAKADPPSPRR